MSVTTIIGLSLFAIVVVLVVVAVVSQIITERTAGKLAAVLSSEPKTMSELADMAYGPDHDTPMAVIYSAMMLLLEEGWAREHDEEGRFTRWVRGKSGPRSKRGLLARSFSTLDITMEPA